MQLPERHLTDRDARAFAMREAGLKYSDIAKALGVSKGTAHKAVQRHLRKVAQEGGEEAGNIAWLINSRYETLIKNLWPFIRPVKVTDPETGAEMTYPGNFDAMDRILKIIAAQTKLFGVTDDVMKVMLTSDAPVLSPDSDHGREVTPDEYARRMLQELITTEALSGEGAEILQALLPGLDSNRDVEDAQLVDENGNLYPLVAEIPSLTGAGEEHPAWVDEEDEYIEGVWIPDGLEAHDREA